MHVLKHFFTVIKAELCQSGRMSTLGKRVMVKAIREFESLQLRHFFKQLYTVSFPTNLICIQTLYIIFMKD